MKGIGGEHTTEQGNEELIDLSVCRHKAERGLKERLEGLSRVEVFLQLLNVVMKPLDLCLL